MSKEELHRLIDRLSDEQVQHLVNAMPSIVVPVDGEPLTAEETQAIKIARDEFERGESIPLDKLQHACLVLSSRNELVVDVVKLKPRGQVYGGI